MESQIRARVTAFLIHLMASAVVIALFSMVVYFIWYPDPYHIILSTIDVMKILIAVDVVLGPIITLILYNIKKPAAELRRDIGIVVLIQFAALAWGGHITYKMRPLVAAYYDNAFYIATMQDFKEEDRSHSSLPGFFEKPRMVYVRPIEDKESRHEFFVKVLQGLVTPLMLQPSHYADIEPYYKLLSSSGRLGSEPIKNKADKQQLVDFWSQREGRAEDYCYHPVLSGNYAGTLVMDCEKPEIIGLLPGHL